MTAARAADPAHAPVVQTSGQAQENDPSAAIAAASEGARKAWSRLVEASGRSDEPISAFHVRAEVRARSGVQTNDFEVEYRYQSPFFIRFALPGKKGLAKRETGRGPGQGQRAYWLHDEKDGTVPLVGRDYTEDRRAVDEMLVVARNFIAFADLAGLCLERLALGQAPPELPEGWEKARAFRKLAWLELESPDFALLHPDRRTTNTNDAGASYLVQLGLDPGDGLPRLAVVRERPRDASRAPAVAPPLLFRLDNYRPHDGFLVPERLHVHAPEPRAPGRATPRFATQPGQEIDLLETRLRPDFDEQTFLP